MRLSSKTDIPGLELGSLEQKESVLPLHHMSLLVIFELLRWIGGGFNKLLCDNNAEIQMDFEYQYYEGAAIALIVINTISFLALLFVIIIYLVRWKQIASFPMRISFYLCVSCIIQNLYVLIYPPMLVYQQQSSGDSVGGFCVFEGMLKTSFDLSSIIWTLIIIYSSYATVVHGYTLERMEWFYLGVGFLLPIILSIIPAVLQEYGFNTYFCWFDAPTSSLQFGLKMGYFFGPLWVFFFLEMFWAYRTYQKLKQVGLEGRQLNIFKKIMLFPIILLITGTFATARLIYNFVTSETGSWLDAASLILLSTYGLFTSVAYGLNPLIRDQIMVIFGKEVDPSSRHSSFTSSQSSRRTDVIAQLITM